MNLREYQRELKKQENNSLSNPLSIINVKKQEILKNIIELKELGLNNRQIGDELGYTRSTISRYLNDVN